MKKYLTLLLTPFILFFSFTMLVSSQRAYAFDPFGQVCDNTTTDSSVCTDKDSTGNPFSGNDGILLTAARIISFITGIASVLMVLFGSIKYITATTRDDGKAVASAKSTITYAFVGVIVSALAQGLIIFIINRLN